MSVPPLGLVYRDSAMFRPRTELVEGLLAELVQPNAPSAVVSCLLAAGALETALADAGDPLASQAARVTDAIAEAFVVEEPLETKSLAARVDGWRSPELVHSSVPEGFAYYALSPRAYATSAALLFARQGPVMVLGIRTIGTTLSAVAKAALAEAGHRTDRLTVRPRGHPYGRVLVLTQPEREVIARARAGAAHFVITDEGPGISGSSFLAVAEALLAQGVLAERITCLGTRQVDLQQLVAKDAARRFARFRFCCAGAGQPWHPSEDHDLSAGKWRTRLHPGRPPVAVWPSAERLKTISGDGRVFRKFAGLGPFGRAVYDRAVELAAQGFIPTPLAPPDSDGFLSHAFVPGTALSETDLTLELASHLGRYIAARSRLPVPAVAADAEKRLGEMVKVNVELELGEGTHVPKLPRLERVVVPDGRLMPHEWLRDHRGAILKTDAVDHGDDHFFPGPTDVAWDLAGAIIEWGLEGATRARLLETYQRLTGDDPSARLPAFEIAYAAFRARTCVMAAHGSTDEEAARWQLARRGYTETLRQALLPG
jgi:hypothetical protein